MTHPHSPGRRLAAATSPAHLVAPAALGSVERLVRGSSNLYLNYTETDPDHPQYGQTVSRYFDSSGNRPQGDANIAQAFLDQALTGNAFVYKWEADTVRERIERGDTDAWKESTDGAGLPKELADGLSQRYEVLTLNMPTVESIVSGGETQLLFDVDADGYLEQTDWISPNHAILAIDRDLNNRIEAVEKVLGARAYACLSDVPDKIDLVDVFRAPEHVDGIVGECIALGIPAIWLQDGVVNEPAAVKARAAGITVVMDRCVYRDYVYFFGRAPRSGPSTPA